MKRFILAALVLAAVACVSTGCRRPHDKDVIIVPVPREPEHPHKR